MQERAAVQFKVGDMERLYFDTAAPKVVKDEPKQAQKSAREYRANRNTIQ